MHESAEPILPEAHRSRLDAVIECLMILLLAFTPFAFGGVEAWARQVVVILSGAMLVCLMLRAIVRPDIPLVWTWAYVPLAAAIVLAFFQILPLPVSLVQAISPQTAALKGRMLSDLGAESTMTLSFNTLASERMLRLGMTVAAVFFVAVNVYRRGEQVRRLLAGITIIGAGAALLALAQDITGATRIYWFVPTGLDAALGGPFVNRNNYCQFMNLSMAAGLGLLVLTMERHFRDTPATLASVADRLGDRRMRPAWLLAGMLVLGMTTVFLSLSRTGMASMLLAGGLAVVLLVRRRLPAWGWAMTGLALLAVCGVLYLGFDGVYQRFASLRNLRDYQGRWQLTCEAAQAWMQFPLIGSGLGSHEFIHPMFDRSDIVARAMHVENEYVQWAEEAGAIGLVVMAAFAVAMLWHFRRCIRNGRSSALTGAAIALGCGLAAVSIHSVTDFGQHLPANACLSIVLAGLIVGISSHASRPQRQTAVASAAASRVGCTFVLAGILAAWGWAATAADATRRGEASWQTAQKLEEEIRQSNWAASESDYARLIAAAEEALAAQSDNVRYRHWLNVYRWHDLSRRAVARSGELVLSEQDVAAVQAILSDLDVVRRQCPTYAKPYILAGQLECFVLASRGRETRGKELIRKGLELAPGDAVACYAAGLLDAREGNVDGAAGLFRRALARDASLFEEIVTVCLDQLGRSDLAVAAIDDQPWRLLKLAERLEQRCDPSAGDVRGKAMDLLATRCDEGTEPPANQARLGDLLLAEGRCEEAANYYRRALTTDCGQVSWRFNLAYALAEAGQSDEAVQQARMCLKLRPDYEPARRLISSQRQAGGVR